MLCVIILGRENEVVINVQLDVACLRAGVGNLLGTAGRMNCVTLMTGRNKNLTFKFRINTLKIDK